MAVNRVVTPRFIVAIVCSVYVHIIRSVGFLDLGVTYPTLHANAPLSLLFVPTFEEFLFSKAFTVSSVAELTASE